MTTGARGRAPDALSALLQPSARVPGYCPRRFSLESDGDCQQLEQLFEQGAVHRTHDTLKEQLAELVEIRRPAATLDTESLEIAIQELLERREALSYGRWIYYPWSGTLVHVLPEEQFEQLRTSRNRHKITPSEQQRLRDCSVGIVGLSVGYVIAETLALEGISRRFRLADFDAVALSNTNRLSCGVQSLGENKALLAARRMFEIDPYLEIEVLAEGINRYNVDRFLTGDGGVDLVIEECDDLATKIRVRERARAHRIPVLMETNDRGLLDIERFDLEPQRPILHGLVKVSADEVDQLATAEKLPFLLDLLGEDEISNRLAASLLEVNETLNGWPQLASGTALGAAIAAEAARRILLGQLKSSGRVRVDLGQLICGDDGEGHPTPEETAIAVEPPRAADRVTTAPKPSAERGARLSEVQVRELVGHAITAPSGGNTQPWRFVWRRRSGWLDCLLDSRHASKTLLDFEGRASELALGAAVENLAIAAGAGGLRSDVHWRPSEERELVCRIRFVSSTADPELERMVPLLEARCTNRSPAPRRRLRDQQRGELQRTALRHGAALALLERDGELESMGELLGEIDRLRFFSPTLYREMMAEIRWSAEEAETSRDGIDIATMELPAEEIAALKLLRQRRVVETVRQLGGGRFLTKPARRAIASSAAVALLRSPDIGEARYFDGGRALQRVWLKCTELGLSFQPWSASVFLFARLEDGDGRGLLPEERETLQRLRTTFRQLLPRSPPEIELLLFRLTHAPAPSVRSLRRPIDDVLTVV